jgi:transposase
MLALPASVRVYLASEPVDMRRGHDGLFAIVKNWGLDPFSGDLFGFVGKRRDRAKILVWHRGGFVLLYKRLEKGRFRIPRVEPGAMRAESAGRRPSQLLAPGGHPALQPSGTPSRAHRGWEHRFRPVAPARPPTPHSARAS